MLLGSGIGFELTTLRTRAQSTYPPGTEGGAGDRIARLRTTKSEVDMGNLQGKVAVVTGAGSGLGQGIAVLFAKEGARVVVADLVGRGDGTVGMIRSSGGEAICVPTDVTEAEAVKRMVNTAVSDYGRLDIIVNNAGIAPPEGLITDCSEEIFDRIVAVNLKGVWLGMKYAIPAMLEVGGGTIINIASHSAFRGASRFSAYAASKGAVVSMSRAVAVGFASRNIRINCVAPGPVMTRLLREDCSEEAVQHWTRLTPRGKLGEVDDVAKLALFLASDDSIHIDAQTIIIDGGMEADLHRDS